MSSTTGPGTIRLLIPHSLIIFSLGTPTFRFFGKIQQRHSLSLIQSLLRLGTKYQIEDLRDEALHYLQQILPGEIAQWDQVEKDSEVERRPADIISMVNLTSELNIGSLHLRALYLCCQLPAHLIVHGVEHPRGRVQLSPEHVVLCFDGRARLTSWKQSMMEDVTWFWDQGFCENEDRECKALQKFLVRRRHSTMWTLDAHPLQPLEVWLKDINPGEAYGSRLCPRCKDRQTKFIQMHRRRVLARLKECFGTASTDRDPASPIFDFP